MRLEKVLARILFGGLLVVIIAIFITLIFLVLRPASTNEVIEDKYDYYDSNF